MRGSDSSSSGVVESFRQFYVRIVGLKREAQAPAQLPAGAGTIDTLPEGGAAAEIWRKAAAILDRETLDALHLNASAAEVRRQARFVMAAVADESFVHLQWTGSDYWLSHLLETRYFHTHSAGETFFSRATALLSSNDPSAGELAAIYLTALGLGFRGKYFGDVGGDAEINRLRTQLADLVRYRNPELLHDSEHLFEDAYDSTIDTGVARRLPDPVRWGWIAGAVVAAWLIVAYIVWQLISGDLRRDLPDLSSSVATSRTGRTALPAVVMPEAST